MAQTGATLGGPRMAAALPPTRLAMSAVGGDENGEAAAYAEGLTSVGRLAEIDSRNFALVREVALSLTKVGDVGHSTGDLNGAAANYEQALTNIQRLSEHDPDNTLWLRDMTVILNQLGDAKLQTGDAGAAAASYDEAL